jgi:PAS domain S-box-containing protein
VSNHLLLKQRSELLKKSEERFRTTFEAAPIGVTNITLDGHLLAANQGYCDFLGYTADELLGMNLRQVTAPEFHQQYLEMIKKVLAGEISDFNHEKQYLRKDGQRVWGHLWVKLVFDIHGLPDHLIGVVENIDRRKRVEASNTVLLQAVEQSPASIIITNLDANIEYVNEAFVQNSGYSREEVIGQNPRFMQSGKTPKETYDALWASLTSGEVWKGELIDKRKDNF